MTSRFKGIAPLLALLLCGGCNGGSGSSSANADGASDAAVGDADFTGGDAHVADAMAGDAAVPEDAAVEDAAAADAAAADAAPDAMVDAGVIDPFGPPPARFERRVLIELTAGAGVGAQPDGYAALETLQAIYGARLIPVAYHLEDAMQTPDALAFRDSWSGLVVPAGVVDRDAGPVGQGIDVDGWTAAVRRRARVEAECGLAIDARTSDRVVVRGACAAEAEVGPLYLAVTLVQDVTGEGPGYDQVNFRDGTPGHPFEGRGDPVRGFEHPRVARATFTQIFGDPVEAADGQFSSTFEIDTDRCGEAPCAIVATLTSGDGPPANRHVENVQQVPVGALQGWSAQIGPRHPFGPPPLTFQRRVLLEYFVGTWVGMAPDAVAIADRLATRWAPQLITVSLHNRDPMETVEGEALVDAYEINSFPSGLIDRIDGPGRGILRARWFEDIESRMATTARCGLAIDAREANAVQVVGACGPRLQDGPVRLIVTVVEDPVVGHGTAYTQLNHLNGVAGHPYAGAGSSIEGFEHPRVQRTTLSADLWGDVIPLEGGQFDRYFEIPEGTCAEGACWVVASISSNEEAATSRRLQNSQQVAVGAVEGWAPGPPPLEPAIGDPPEAFEQAVFVEATVSASVPFTPDAYAIIGDALETWGARIVTAYHHRIDPMAAPETDRLVEAYGMGGIPSALIDRSSGPNPGGAGRELWSELIEASANRTPPCGLALDARHRDVVEVRGACVAGFPDEQVGILVSVVENSVDVRDEEYGQANAYNATEGHPYFRFGEVIFPFRHTRVFRRWLSDDVHGDPVALEAGGFSREFALDPELCDEGECWVIATLISLDADPLERRAINTQQVRIGQAQDWSPAP